jgi:hypothetical protein
MSQRAIADKYNISQKSVLRVLHGKIIKVNVETGFSKVLLSYENRWELILAEENLLSEGEANLEVSAMAGEV